MVFPEGRSLGCWLLGLVLVAPGACLAGRSARESKHTAAVHTVAVTHAQPLESVSQGQISGTGRIELASGVEICVEPSAEPVGSKAAEYLQRILHRRFSIPATVVASIPPASTESTESTEPARVIIREVPEGALKVAESGVPVALGRDGYMVNISADLSMAVITGSGGNGVIRGALALADWTRTDRQQMPVWPQATFHDRPGMHIRLTRSILLGHRKPEGMDADTLAEAQLDWWARWGLNHTFVPSTATGERPAHQERLRTYLHAAHLRGMKAGVNLGARSLCAADPDELGALVEKAERLLSSGCDFVQLLFDDLPSTRCAGHCPRCIDRFGGSLAREQRHILESLQAVVERHGPDRKLIWCPTYYSLGMTGYRKAAEGPDAYFSILGESDAVRQAWMYHCAFDRDFNAYLDGKGLTRRIWWYNGIRTAYYMVSREFDGFDGWGKRLVIPGVKDFQSFFCPFENGWLMPSYASADLSAHICVAPLVSASRDAEERTLIPQASWDALHGIGERMDGVYYCGATTPYHIAMAGLFAARPERFDQNQARMTVLESMFGPNGVEPALRWQAAYETAQRFLARAQGRPLDEQTLAQLEALTERMTASETDLRAAVEEDRGFLARPIVATFLDEMTSWQKKVEALATGRGTGAN